MDTDPQPRPEAGPEPAAETEPQPQSETEPEPAADTGAQARPEAGPEPADTAAPQDDSTLWERVRARLNERFPPGTAMLLSDDLQIGVSLDGDTLTLSMLNDFARNMADRPDILQTLGALASDTAGRPIQVRAGAPGAPEMKRNVAEINKKLEALQQYDIVKIKQSKYDS